jgi:hypothetical protein
LLYCDILGVPPIILADKRIQEALLYVTSIDLMMEAARTSETFVNFYQTTRRYNPEDSHLPSIIYLLRSAFLSVSFYVYLYILFLFLVSHPHVPLSAGPTRQCNGEHTFSHCTLCYSIVALEFITNASTGLIAAFHCRYGIN